jgi:hypothetical protein
LRGRRFGRLSGEEERKRREREERRRRNVCQHLKREKGNKK